ncbi:MAG: aspartate-semialdehyde dehydrogenase, partial [Anaplasma sp.]
MGPIAVAGATGNVGRLVLKVLSEFGFPVQDVVALASAESVGKRLSYGEEGEVQCAHLDGYDFRDALIAIFATGSEVSARYVPRVVESGCVVVDGSSFFRMEEDVPLVIPEVNRDALAAYTRRNIVASPNCSTTQMLVA